MRRGEYRYSVPRDLLDGQHRMYQAGVLDMMRYDAARVVAWDDETITLQSARYTADRWASFGIYPTLISDMAGA